jgi:hypothetical protein
MRVYLITLLITLTACTSLKKSQHIKAESKPVYRSLQKLNSDTLLFINQSIISRKEYYKGKELNVLLKDLGIPLKKYALSVNPKNNIEVRGLYLFIYSKMQQTYKMFIKEDPIQITVDFQTPLPIDKSKELITRSQLDWTPEVLEYYGNQIVKDIGILPYNFNKPK